MFDQLRHRLQRRLDQLTGQDIPPPAPVSDPEQANNLRAKGNALLAEEKLEAAEACFREALEHHADDTKLLICLGYVLKEQARFAEARVVLRRVANLGKADPEAHEAHYLLAEISELQADPEDAKRHLAQVLTLKPDFTRACADLVRLLRETGPVSAARDLLTQSVNACPDCVEYRLWLAEACADAMDYQATVEHLEAVIRLGGGNVRINITIGAALCRLDRGEEAQLYFDQAAKMDPAVAYEVCYHQGYLQSRIGNSAEAIALFEKSIQLHSGYLASHQMLLFNLCFAQTQPPGRYQEAALRFNRVVRPPQQFSAYPEAMPAKCVLRVGFSCGEFRNHPVYHFLCGILDHIDRSQFELIAYSNNEVDDHLTDSFKKRMDDWQVIRDMSDDDAAALIHAQHVDVLIDLCGHSGEARLPVFARRPAPVQVTWLGYFASTGLEEMDYIIADPGCVPPDSTEWFSEKIFRMPATRLCMARPNPSREIAVVLPPCATKGQVTFGSFQQAAKITPQVLRVWSQVLAAVPSARLRIQSSAFGSTVVCKRVSKDMQAAGIDLSRVEMLGALAWEEYLEAHREVDMLIDTFPYTGGTTTAFALWMGVPVISIEGDTMLSRQGATMLRCVGLSNWIARDEADYVDKAVRFASDVNYLIQLRMKLRDTAEKSPLFDTASFTRNFENALTNMYSERMSTIRSQAEGKQSMHSAEANP